MVFKNNKQPFPDDDPCQFAYKHLRRLDCGGQLAAFAEVPSFRGIPEEQSTSDGEKDGFSQSQGKITLGGDTCDVFSVITNEEFENNLSDVPKGTAAGALGDVSSLSWVRSSAGEVVRLEPVKRPLADGGSYQVAVKRTRQADQNSRVHYSAEIAASSDISEGQLTSDLPVAPGKDLEKSEGDVGSEDPAKNAPSSSLSLPCSTCSTIEEGTRSESPVRLSFFPGYSENGRTIGSNDLDEQYSPVFDYTHRKIVAIGPNHQADVPVWKSMRCKNSLGESDGCVSSSQASVIRSASAGNLLIDKDGDDRWMGTCVLSMPDSNLVALETRVENDTIGCICSDKGSMKCMRQHVMEAREKLKKKLGQDRFTELGFCDMGEDVAHGWTEEEEQLFHEVVFLNPVSMGKNFWGVLPRALPSRSSKELVSYYFNVFMLRKRAEQNRSDPLHVDSDDDEWQDGDDSEFETTEEEDGDSEVESPNDEDDTTFNNDGRVEVVIHEMAKDGTGSDHSVASDDDELRDESKFVPDVQPMDKNSQDDGEDRDVQDDSCTSYESQHNRVDPCGGPVNFSEHMELGNDGLSGISNHEYSIGDYDPKTWEIDYIRGTEKAVDFLPTCSMIEEVFGKGSLDNESRDSNGGII